MPQIERKLAFCLLRIAIGLVVKKAERRERGQAELTSKGPWARPRNRCLGYQKRRSCILGSWRSALPANGGSKVGGHERTLFLLTLRQCQGEGDDPMTIGGGVVPYHWLPCHSRRVKTHDEKELSRTRTCLLVVEFEGLSSAGAHFDMSFLISNGRGHC